MKLTGRHLRIPRSRPLGLTNVCKILFFMKILRQVVSHPDDQKAAQQVGIDLKAVSSPQPTALRQRAEAIVAKGGLEKPSLPSESLEGGSPVASQQTLQELLVHQVELEMQNEELQRAQADLEASRARYFDLYDLAPVGYCTISGNGLRRILEANVTASKLVGMSQADLVKLPFTRIIHREDADKFYLMCKQLIKTRATQACELRMLKRNGTAFGAHLAATVVQKKDDFLIYVAITDITDRIRAEEELKRKNEEIELFAYSVSHDLGSPLLTIKMFLGYLEKDIRAKKEDQATNDLEIIHTAADKMGIMLKELLTFARIGHNGNATVSVPLQEVVKEAMGLVAGQLAERGVQVEVTPAPVFLFGDRARLVEVFQNLLDNAVKFSVDQPHPRIEIGVEHSEGELVIFVRDNGKGIEPRHIENLFGLFEKLDPSTPGAGMGLAFVRRIVEMHGGKIQAQSGGPGQGVTFRFTLAKTKLQPQIPA